MQYRVLTATDDPSLLQDRLRSVTEANGRVVSVMWLPKRTNPDGFSPMAGYTIVAEYPKGAAPT
jgi:hypothetical protein